LGFLKGLINDIKKEAIANAAKPSKREQDNERVHRAQIENSIEGRARKIAKEKGVSLESLMKEARRKMNK
jgi:hypothetical protein